MKLASMLEMPTTVIVLFSLRLIANQIKNNHLKVGGAATYPVVAAAYTVGAAAYTSGEAAYTVCTAAYTAGAAAYTVGAADYAACAAAFMRHCKNKGTELGRPPLKKVP